jgi:hypothetical protein
LFKKKKMAECVVVGCRKQVCMNKNGQPSTKCQLHKDIHAAQNRMSYLNQKRQMEEMRMRAEAYEGLVKTVNSLTDELRAYRADNEKLRQRAKK